MGNPHTLFPQLRGFPRVTAVRGTAGPCLLITAQLSGQQCNNCANVTITWSKIILQGQSRTIL